MAEFSASLEGEVALRPMLDEIGRGMLSATPDQIREEMASVLSPVDFDVFSGALAEYLHATLHGALDGGVDGWLDDDLAFTEPWGFDVASIDRPLLLLHGADDRFVPVSHGRWLAARIPGVEARITETDGHLTLLTRRMREVNDWLLSHR